MSSNVIKIFENSDLSKKLSNNGLKKAMQFDWSKSKNLWKEVFLKNRIKNITNLRLHDTILMLKGLNVYKALKKINDLQEMSKDEFYNWVEVKKWDIAKFHYSNNIFYKGLIGKHFPSDWNDLPILNKETFQTDIENFFQLATILKIPIWPVQLAQLANLYYSLKINLLML